MSCIHVLVPSTQSSLYLIDYLRPNNTYNKHVSSVTIPYSVIKSLGMFSLIVFVVYDEHL